MLYSIGDIIECKENVNATCLEMSNAEFDIKPGDQYKITDKDTYPITNPSHWYELTSMTNKDIVLNAWNDNGHMILDDKFKRIEY